MQVVVDVGTARIIRKMGFKHPAGGKTGTTNNFKDSWFNGFTKTFSTSVWVGYDDNEPMVDQAENGLTGASAAAPIWAFYMQKALQGKNLINFPIPEGIKFEKVDVNTGTLADNQSTETMNVAVKEETVILPRATESISIDKEPVEPSITSELTNVPNP